MDQILTLIIVFLLTAALTIIFKLIFTRWEGNLYTDIRDGTPRAIGLAPFLVLLLFFPPPGNILVGIIGLLAFLDDLIGRKKIESLPFELGQLSRGVGMLLVMVVGYFYFGPVSILIALMVQPLNIADMQPGTACSTLIMMSAIVGVLLYLTTGNGYLAALIVLAACLGYAPLDYRGKIMMGEVGNHSFAVTLGIIYTLLGTSMTNWGANGVFLFVLILLLITSILIAFLRRDNLTYYLENELCIANPYFGDLLMDVLTGGGLGDLVRKLALQDRAIKVENQLGKQLGLRRLFYNPNASYKLKL